MVNELQKEFKVCPYHFIRTMIHRYDVVLMPYQCLLDQRMRKKLGIKVEGNIIVLDEAHNAEEIAEKVESFDIEHRELPKGLVQQLRLGRNCKNGLVSWKAVEKLVKISNAVNHEADIKADDKEYRTFSLDLQARVRRILISNGKDKNRKLSYGMWNVGNVTKIYCLSARVAFRHLLEEHPRNVVLASATLPDKEESEDIFGIAFSKGLKFYLENPHMLYLTVLSEVDKYQNNEGKETNSLYFIKKE